MSVPALHEDDVEALGLPGRDLCWLVAPGALKAEGCSACMIRVAPRGQGPAGALAPER